MADPPSVAQTVPLTASEAFSGIFGSISVTCWIFLLLPQLYENYKAGSGDSISLAFIFVWLIGDVTNLAGAVWAQLVPTVVATAIWFCIMDMILILQCLYYKLKQYRRAAPAAAPEVADDRRESVESIENPETPLLSRRRGSAGSSGLPGSHRRRPSAATIKRTRTNSMASIPEEYSEYVSGPSKELVKNLMSVAFVFGVGAAGWSIFWQLGLWTPSPAPGQGSKHGHPDPQPFGAQVLGYISAAAYLGARLPQIYKNWRAKSCDGLSLLFFILSLLGNLTYGIGILAHSLDKDYILKNLPWLIGSLGTMFEDSTIFAQFRIYGDRNEEESIEE